MKEGTPTSNPTPQGEFRDDAVVDQFKRDLQEAHAEITRLSAIIDDHARNDEPPSQYNIYFIFMFAGSFIIEFRCFMFLCVN